MKAWPMTTLGQLCREGGGFIRTGPFGSQLHRSDYTDDPEGIPVVMPKDMARGRIDTSTIARIDEVHCESSQATPPHSERCCASSPGRRGQDGMGFRG